MFRLAEQLGDVGLELGVGSAQRSQTPLHLRSFLTQARIFPPELRVTGHERVDALAQTLLVGDGGRDLALELGVRIDVSLCDEGRIDREVVPDIGRTPAVSAASVR